MKETWNICTHNYKQTVWSSVDDDNVIKKKRTKMYCVVIGRKKVPFVWVSDNFYFMDSVVQILPEFLLDLTQCLCAKHH